MKKSAHLGKRDAVQWLQSYYQKHGDEEQSEIWQGEMAALGDIDAQLTLARRW